MRKEIKHDSKLSRLYRGARTLVILITLFLIGRAIYYYSDVWFWDLGGFERQKTHCLVISNPSSSQASSCVETALNAVRQAHLTANHAILVAFLVPVLFIAFRGGFLYFTRR